MKQINLLVIVVAIFLVASPSSLLAQTVGETEEAPEPPEAVQPFADPPESDDTDEASAEHSRPRLRAVFEKEEPRDAAQPTDPDGRPMVKKRLLQGFRVGYSLLMNSDETVLQELGATAPHSFLIGYELFYRMVGHSWLNVLLVGNVLVGGLEQSKFFPSVNLLLGFELENSFQLGVGVNLTPQKDKESHMILAAGWTPLVGSFYVPVHFFIVPDVDGYHRTGITLGVTF